MEVNHGYSNRGTEIVLNRSDCIGGEKGIRQNFKFNGSVIESHVGNEWYLF